MEYTCYSDRLNYFSDSFLDVMDVKDVSVSSFFPHTVRLRNISMHNVFLDL